MHSLSLIPQILLEQLLPVSPRATICEGLCNTHPGNSSLVLHMLYCYTAAPSCVTLSTQGLFDEASPAFAKMGKRSLFLGEVGAGARMKLVVNMIMVGFGRRISFSVAAALLQATSVPCK